MKVNNVPGYAYDHKYVVARLCDGEYWFWGAWDDLKEAQRVAQEMDGIVVETALITEV